MRRHQGQALRVLRNLDPAGRGRLIGRAGSEGMSRFCLTKGMEACVTVETEPSAAKISTTGNVIRCTAESRLLL